jgi:hypothetical protein
MSATFGQGTHDGHKDTRKNIPTEELRGFVAHRRESEGGMGDAMPGVAVPRARRSVAMAMEAVYG